LTNHATLACIEREIGIIVSIAFIDFNLATIFTVNNNYGATSIFSAACS